MIDDDSPEVSNITHKRVPCLLDGDDLAILSTIKQDPQRKLNNLLTY